MAFAVRQYQPGAEFVVVRDMDFGDRKFKAGDDFPWRAMGVHEAVVQILWRAVRLEVKRAVPAQAVGQAAAAKPAPAPAKPSIATKPAQQNQLPNRR